MIIPLILCLGISEAILPPLTFGRPRGGFLQTPDDYNYPQTDPQYIIESNITQSVDHFNSSNTATWSQRYQYNSKFYNESRPLAFLMLGGESPIGIKWVKNENISMMLWAKEFGAAAFQVEHRFYGPKENTPIPDQTTESLKLLTIDQALADIRQFINQMNNLYFNGKNVKWITFGGSYPGSLSALFRETYPGYTIGAVSTSSAVHFFVDYYGYAVNTESTYRTVSNSCAENIRTGFKKIIDMVYAGKDSRAQLQKKMNLCESFDDPNIPITKAVQFFFSNLYGVFQGINQYTGDNRNNATRYGNLGVPAACNIMNNATLGDEVDRIKAVWDFDNVWEAPADQKCNPNNYTDFIAQMSDISYSNDDIVSARSWVWQTCTELGYFQTTDGNNGIFGSIIPLDFYTDQCTAMFGNDYNLDKTFDLVKQTRSQYYDNYKGTKVVFPNGSFDPWKSLGMLTSNADNDVDAFLINGTAHCADMYPPRAEDPQSLTDARARIHKHLEDWITQGFTETQSTGMMSLFVSLQVVLLSFLFQ